MDRDDQYMTAFNYRAAEMCAKPTDGNYFAMKGIEKIHYIIGLLRRKLGAEVRILGYFMTK